MEKVSKKDTKWKIGRRLGPGIVSGIRSYSNCWLKQIHWTISYIRYQYLSVDRIHTVGLWKIHFTLERFAKRVDSARNRTRDLLLNPLWQQCTTDLTRLEEAWGQAGVVEVERVHLDNILNWKSWIELKRECVRERERENPPQISQNCSSASTTAKISWIQNVHLGIRAKLLSKKWEKGKRDFCLGQ